MIYLVDTDVLVPFSDIDNPDYQIVQNAVQKLEGDGHKLRTTSQNFAEFWNLSTRHVNAKDGLGRTPSETEQFLQEVEHYIQPFANSASVFRLYKRKPTKTTTNMILTPTGKFIGKNTYQTTQHNISENYFKCNENTCGGICCNHVSES